ncbi:MAG: T9SS type A sorting domain-containing protein [Bacteroidota bacterium]
MYKYTLLFGFLFATIGLNAQQDCSEDTTPPIAVCLSDLTRTAIDEFGAVVWAYDVDEGSSDACSAVSLFITRLADDTGSAPSTASVVLPAIAGTYPVVLYVVDEAGNENSCWTNVNIDEIITGGCTTDDDPPTIVCLNGFVANLNPTTGEAGVHVSDIVVESTDNCTTTPGLSLNLEDESTGQPQGSEILTLDEAGTYALEVWTIDDFGNADYCVTNVTVENNADCSADIVPPIAICDEEVVANVFAGQTLEVDAAFIDDGSYDNCSAVDLRLVLVSESDGSLPMDTSVTLPAELGDYPVELWVVDDSGNTNVCVTNIEVINVYYGVFGQVFLDDNDNCELDDQEIGSGFGGWMIRATDIETGISETVSTNSSGNYAAILSLPTDAPRDILVELLAPNGSSTSCPTTRLIEDVTTSGTPELATHFALGLVEDCNYLTVDVAAPFLRRCFPNDIVVHYNNLSANPVDEVTIELELDEFLAIQSASIPYSALGDNRYEFEIGTLAEASSGAFTLNAILSCEAELGSTQCIGATIEPFTCIDDEDFAELIVEGSCDEANDEVQFRVQNIGSDDMLIPQDVHIVEDVIMYMDNNPIQLDAGQHQEFSFPATGATWRLEVTQDASFPYGGIASAFVEGCGGFNPGIATQFLTYNSNPNVDQLCLENIGSYDPNDKQALPLGFGESHYIEANTPLEYLIRFQNTGTDTAFNVRIEDQLSAHLDPSTIVPGASSHPYRMSLNETGLLTFHFNDIMLPDSNVNLEASNGFVQFSIQQRVDNPIGTIIENNAGIYFDFNEPIITNTVWHTIGEEFITVSSYEVLQPEITLLVAPNPLLSHTSISLDGIQLESGRCLIYDSQGRLVCEVPMQNNRAEVSRASIPQSGLYLFRIVSEEAVLAQGKLLVH